jgi:hypothetical protein
MRTWLSAADIYVMASRHEGFPVAPLEGMAGRGDSGFGDCRNNGRQSSVAGNYNSDWGCSCLSQGIGKDCWTILSYHQI